MEASKPVKKENHAVTIHPRYRISAAQLTELQLPGRWEGFTSSQHGCNADTPYLDLNYDGEDLRVEEIVEQRKIDLDKVDPGLYFLAGLCLEQQPTEYETFASYEASLKWERDGSLTWQNPKGQYEGGKVWKLDRSLSNANQLRWISEEGGGKLPEIFFWRRVPDTPVPDIHRHDNNVLWYHGVHKMLGELKDELLDIVDELKYRTKVAMDQKFKKKVCPSQSHIGLPNLIDTNRHVNLLGTKAGIGVKPLTAKQN